MQLLDDYFNLQKQIYGYFGYVEDWVKIPLDDCTDYFWHLTGEGHDGYVTFASDKSALKSEEGDFYQNSIYTQRFLPKWVYRGPEFTMICVDTQTDGNKFLSIFDNSKELKDIFGDPE